MRVIGDPYWGVRVKPGDALRSNVTYDTEIQSTYENMGIAVSLLAPNTHDGKPTAPGVNPFKAPVDRSKRLQVRRPRGEAADALQPGPASSPTARWSRTTTTAAPQGEWTASTRARRPSNVTIANFLYAPGDLSTIEMSGVPTVKLGETLDFTNLDGAAIYHTATSCAFPCLGPTGTSFPLADGTTSSGRSVDFDSGELGIGAAGDRPGQADPAVGPAGHRRERATSPVRSSPTSAASTRGCAARSRSPSEINWRRNGPSPSSSPARFGWKELSEDLPVDVMPCSNDEYFPPPPSVAQRAIMDLASRETERVRTRFGMTRAQFVRTAAATAIGFWAVDLVRMGRFGSYGYAQAGMKRPDACDLEWAGRKGLETLRNLPGEFIFDVQSHHVDPDGMWRVSNPAFEAFFSAVWPQAREGGEVDPIQNLSRFHYLKEVFLDSATTMSVLSVVPTSPDTRNPLPLAEAAETVHTGQRPRRARGAASCTPS